MINVAQILLNAAKKNGDNIAVKDVNRQITYSELLNSAYELACNINTCTPGTNKLILIITSRTIESFIAIWGVVCSGNYYVCIDNKTPEKRYKYIISQIKPDLIILADEKLRMKVSSDIKILTAKYSKNTYSISNMRKNIKGLNVIDEDPLYMVFTSGSTGNPKAIIKSQRSLISFVEEFVSEFNLEENVHEIFGNQASFDFDVSAKDIYISAYISATVCIIPNNCFLIPAKLIDYLSDNKVSILIWAASAIKYIYRFRCLDKVQPQSLKKVFFSGESMPVECISYWRKYLPHTMFVNMYAPSEITGNCLYHVVTDDVYNGILPLDRVFSNVDVMVLNECYDEIKDSEKGELYIRGAFLAKGYYKENELTNKRFIQNPKHNLYPDIVYKTGDYMYKIGNYLYFAGREDNQIKHMGHRIELEEIEMNCLKCGVSTDICILYDNEKEKIILLTDDVKVTYENVVNKLKDAIPKYMIPGKVVLIDALPYNTRGKIDRNRALMLYKEIKNNV